MNVSTQDLLKVVTDTLAKHEANTAIYADAAKTWKTRQRAKNVANALEKQRALRDALSAAIKAGKPLGAEGLQKACGGRSWTSDMACPATGDAPFRFTQDGIGYERPGGLPVAELTALKSVLEAIHEDVISDGQLQRLGFKNIGWVFRSLIGMPK